MESFELKEGRTGEYFGSWQPLFSHIFFLSFGCLGDALFSFGRYITNIGWKVSDL